MQQNFTIKNNHPWVYGWVDFILNLSYYIFVGHMYHLIPATKYKGVDLYPLRAPMMIPISPGTGIL